MLKEFRSFISRGNVLDLAIGIIIGAAFTAIVNSLVSDIINPLIGLIFGGHADFTNFFIPLAGQAGTTLEQAKEGGPVFAYGSFITAVLNFLIVAFVLFMLIKLINRFRQQQAEQPAPEPAPTTEERLLTDIRDVLMDTRTLLAKPGAAARQVSGD